VTVTTTARSAALPPLFALRRVYLKPELLAALAPILALAVSLLFVARTRRGRLGSSVAILFLVLWVTLEFTACGGGGGSTLPPPTGTPAGTYTVAVTGTSGNTSHTTSLTLIVN
jgi:hypothetical protein